MLDLSYQYRCITSLQCSLTYQGTEFTLSRSSFAQMLINLFADCAYLPVKQTFEFRRQSKLKRRDISYNRCYQILYTFTMYFLGRRNTCNMLRSLKQKQRKSVDLLPQIYQAKMFCWRSISKRATKLCPLFARRIGSKRFMWMCQSPSLPYLHISSVDTCYIVIYPCNTNCLEPGQDQWIPNAIFLISQRKCLQWVLIGSGFFKCE